MPHSPSKTSKTSKPPKPTKPPQMPQSRQPSQPSTSVTRRTRSGGRPSPGSIVYKFYDRYGGVNRPTPLTIHEESTCVGPHGEQNPQDGADTSGLDPTRPVPISLIRRGMRVPESGADLSSSEFVSFPSPIHAYVYQRMWNKTFPSKLRKAVRAMPLDELKNEVRTKAQWCKALHLYGKKKSGEGRSWTKAQWSREWYDNWLPKWYRQPQGSISKAQHAWHRILLAAARQNPQFARDVCATGQRSLALRRCIVDNPAFGPSRTDSPDDQVADTILNNGTAGAYGVALMDVREELRQNDETLASVPDAFRPYSGAPHVTTSRLSLLEPVAPTRTEADAAAETNGTDMEDVENVEDREAGPSSLMQISQNDQAVENCQNGQTVQTGESPAANEKEEQNILEAERAGAKLLRSLPTMRRCAFCDKVNPPLACDGCLQRAYCSRACQREDWQSEDPGHRAMCARLAAQNRPAIQYR